MKNAFTIAFVSVLFTMLCPSAFAQSAYEFDTESFGFQGSPSASVTVSTSGVSVSVSFPSPTLTLPAPPPLPMALSEIVTARQALTSGTFFSYRGTQSSGNSVR